MAEPVKQLSMWEWDLLTGAWRYYETGRNITSAGFPSDIVREYWTSGKYDRSVLLRIASQFADCDHARSGESFWHSYSDIDAVPWISFYNFCRGFVHGFADIVVKMDSGRRTNLRGCFRIRCPSASGSIRTAWLCAADYIADRWIAPIDDALVVDIPFPGVFEDNNQDKKQE